ncbi:MAG: Zinc protease [Parcubacteria group bacterium]|nr:Zinc protease [Parcubacteria group bacterium]
MAREPMNVTEHEKGTMRLFAVRTGAKDVVTIEGSVLGGYYMQSREDMMVPRMVTGLLDAGTKNKTKEQLRGALAAKGASLYFAPGGDRTHFYAACLPEDAEFMFKLIVECLSESTFPTAEVANQKKRSLAELEESKNDTGFQASMAFSRLIYDPTHVNYPDEIDVEMKRVAKATRKDMLTFRSKLGQGGLVLAVAGDIVPDSILAKAEKAFSKLPKGTAKMTEKKANAKKPSVSEALVSIPDKATIDTYIGVHVPMTYESDDFTALKVFTSMLGGGGLSTGHLMRTIRERDGLTYGIAAGTKGFAGKADGAFVIHATFSPATFDQAVANTRKEIKIFLETGMTEETLQTKKDELTGRYYVGLSTTRGLASALHTIGIEEKPLAYIDEYPSLIHAVTVADLKRVAAIIPFDKLSLAAAGTFIKK